MLAKSKNRQLMEVGAGTPMGELLRRYWHPIAAVSQFEDNRTLPVRLMGEDLVLYKDLSGTFGLIDRQCPHRRSDLSYGFVEECGLRCNYHGWLYDEKGACIAQPYEDTAHPEAKFKDKIKIKAYKVEPLAGLLWAYMGPEPAPLLPNWEPFTWTNGFVQVVFSDVPCNWFQCAENCIDPVHFEWMHSNWSIRLGGETGPYIPKHVKVDFKEHEWGFTYHRIREDTDENHQLWTVGRNYLWPNCLFTGNHFEWRVPVDDDNTLSVGWFYNRVPNEQEPYVQNRIPHWFAPVKDEKTGRWITSHVMNQDFVAWVGQGIQSDRENEHLGNSDKGVAMARRQLFADMEMIQNGGGDPKGTVRDPKVNECIELPILGKERIIKGYSINEKPGDPASQPGASKRFIFLAGQPAGVKLAYEDAMGFKMTDWDEFEDVTDTGDIVSAGTGVG